MKQSDHIQDSDIFSYQCDEYMFLKKNLLLNLDVIFTVRVVKATFSTFTMCAGSGKLHMVFIAATYYGRTNYRPVGHRTRG